MLGFIRSRMVGTDAPDARDCRPGICSFDGPTQSTSSTSTLDPTMKGLILGNASRAQGIADQPFQAYNGQLAPGLSQNQSLAQGAAQNLNTAGAPALNYAQNGAAGLLNFQPQNINPSTASTFGASAANAPLTNAASQGDFSGLISKYQNPYTNDVVNSSLNDIEMQRQRAINGNNASATAAHAFGGTRQAVNDALTNEASLRTSADTASNLRSQGFNAAAGLAGQEAGMNQQTALTNAGAANNNSQFNAGNLQQTGLFNATANNANSQFNANATNAAAGQNQSAGIAGAGINQNAASLLNTIGNSQRAGANDYLSGLLTSGGVDQTTQAAQNTAQYQEFLRSLQQPYQGQTLLNQSLGLLPNSGTTSGTSSTNPGTTGIIGGLGSLGLGVGSLSNSSLLGSWLGG